VPENYFGEDAAARYDETLGEWATRRSSRRRSCCSPSSPATESRSSLASPRPPRPRRIRPRRAAEKV